MSRNHTLSPSLEVKARRTTIVALDTTELPVVYDLVEACAPYVGAFKIGKELFTSHGPRAVETVIAAGGRVFLDLKYHDIPNTVAQAVKAAAGLGVWMCNVHASGGREMLTAAAESFHNATTGRLGEDRPLLLAVTVLTSLDDALCAEAGFGHPVAELVPRLAKLAMEAGCDGVVASPREVTAIRSVCGPDFAIVTPGVRPAAAGLDDQRRVATPGQAIADGADYLVIGRPITRAADPGQAARDIAAEIEDAFARREHP